MLTSKYSEAKEIEVTSTISRWFLGAKDRDGGKKERLTYKTTVTH